MGIFLLGVVLAVPTAVFAQESAGVKIQPSVIEEKVDPGQQLSGKITVTNVSGATQLFFLSKRNIIGIEEDGQPIFDSSDDDTGLEITSWISLAEDVIELGAGEERTIDYTIFVPDNAPPGGHFAGIFFALRNEEGTNQGASIGFQVGSIINLQVGGEVVETLEVREFLTDKSVYTKPHVSFTTRVLNVGNVLARPRGTIEIQNFSGDTVGTLVVNEQGAGIIPGTTREYTTLWEDEKFRIGKYNVVLALTYGDVVKQTVSQLLSFWVIPLNVIIPVLGGIIGVFAIFYIGIKLHIRRLLKNAGGKATRVIYRDKATASRIAVILIALLSFTVIFLILLFLFLA